MEQQQTNQKNPLYLLDRSYKKIGYFVTFFALLGMGVKATGDFTLSLGGAPNKPDAVSFALDIALITGLTCIAWCKEKIEDELAFMMRMKSVVASFLSIILFSVIITVIQLFGGMIPVPVGSLRLVQIMLLIYIIAFNAQKKNNA